MGLPLRFVLFLPVLVARAGLHYIANASFDARSYGVTLLGSPTRLNSPGTGPAFNPSVVELPAAMREGLSPDARYVAAFRFAESQCQMLRQHGRRLGGGMKSFMLLLDGAFQLVARVVEENGWVLNLGMHDVRLERYGDDVVVHGMYYKGGRAQWRVSRLRLGAFPGTPAKVLGRLEGFTHPDVAQPWVEGLGKNFGIIWSGSSEEPFRVLYWLRAERGPDVRRGLPPPPAPSGEADGAASAPLRIGGYEAHNNVSPAPLGPRYPGLRIGVCHTHTDAALPAHVHEPGGSYHGNTYMHYFFIVRDAPPYDVLAVSPPLCFPSEADASRCDVIQFVMSLDPTPGGFLVSYGVNDCEAAAVELALDDVVRFAASALAADARAALLSAAGGRA